jgi:hypothetical protein
VQAERKFVVYVYVYLPSSFVHDSPIGDRIEEEEEEDACIHLNCVLLSSLSSYGCVTRQGVNYQARQKKSLNNE